MRAWAVPAGLVVGVLLTGCHAAADPDAAAQPRPTYVSATPGLGRDTVYVVGSTPAGPRLFRDVRGHGGPTTDPATYLAELQAHPVDPDFTTRWPAGSLTGVEQRLEKGRVTGWDVHLAVRTTDRLALQQVVLTLTGVDAVPVRFLVGGRAATGPVAPDPSVVSPVSVDYPAGGERVAGSFEADGHTTGGPVAWTLTRDGRTVDHGTARLEPGPQGGTSWRATVARLTSLDPGDCTFTASVVVDGTTYRDTRVVTVE